MIINIQYHAYRSNKIVYFVYEKNLYKAILLTFNIQYSIVFLIVKNDKIGNLKGVALYGKNNK